MSGRATPLPIIATSGLSLSLSARNIPKEIFSAVSTPNPPYCMPSLHYLVEQTQDHTDIRLKKVPLDGPLPAIEKKDSSKIFELTDSESVKAYSSPELEDHLFSFFEERQPESMKRSIQRLEKLYTHRCNYRHWEQESSRYWLGRQRCPCRTKGE